MENQTPSSRKLASAGYALGFGLGGFFDGILLHQVLQWHHLLSAVADARQNLRFLLMADGVFHILMYLICAIGLWLLWSGKRAWTASGADRRLACDGLIGFGAWHIVDAFFSHWILGIHRIRMDTDAPLLWDLVWLAAFGVVPLAFGFFLRNRSTVQPTRTLISPIALVVAVAISGPLASLPPAQQTTVIVLFRPGIAPGEAAAAIDSVGGRIVWADAYRHLWAVDLPKVSDANGLYLRGALIISTSFIPAACFNWVSA